jgi:outer membrane cobalamin receptor
MKGLRLLFLSYSFLVAQIGYSQNEIIVSGTVYDEINAELPEVTVYLKSASNKTKTDLNGQFKLQLPAGSYWLYFKHPLFLTDSVFVHTDELTFHPIQLKLQPMEQAVEEVIIRVGKFDKPLEEQTVSMEIIRPEMIENKNTRSIESALDQTPGLNILDGEPQIRGGSGFTFGVGSKVAVMVDDMPMLSGDAGRPEWGFIPVENIHQVEVIKGAASVLSGSSALSGSVNIRSAYPTSTPLTKVHVYSGMYSTPSNTSDTWYSDRPLIIGANFLHTHKFKKIDLVIGGNMNHDHGYIGPPVTSEFVTKDTVTAFSNRDMSSQRVRLNTNITYRSSRIKGLSYGLNGNFMLAHTNMTFAWLDDSSGLYRGYPGAAFLQDQLIFHLDPTILYQKGKQKHSLHTRMLRTVNQMSANQSNQSTVFYGDYQYKNTFVRLAQIDFISGLSAINTHSYASIYAGSGSSTNSLLNLSGYTQLEKKIAKKCNVSVGGRMEYFNLNNVQTAFQPIFRAGASWKLHQATFVRGSYGQGYRFPTITERYIKTGVGNFGVFPNPALKPESSWNAEIGVKQGVKIGGVKGLFDIAGFWQEYQNTIEYMFGIWDAASSTSFAGFKFLNTGRSRVLGLDVSFAGMAKTGKQSELTFLAGYNYIVPKTLNPDYVYAVDDFNRKFSYNSTSLDSASRILKYRFLHNIKADLEWNYRKKISVGMSVKYFSKIVNMDRIIKDFETFTINAPYLQDIRYMDYFNQHRFGNTVIDVRFSYAINQQQKIALIGNNILNRCYSLRPLKIEAPRSILLQYTYQLGGKD